VEILATATTSIVQLAGGYADSARQIVLQNLGANSVTIKAVAPYDGAVPTVMTGRFVATVAAGATSSPIRVPCGFKIYLQSSGGSSDVKVSIQPWAPRYDSHFRYEALKGFRPLSPGARLTANIALLSGAQSIGTGKTLNYAAVAVEEPEIIIVVSGCNNNTTDRTPEAAVAASFEVKALFEHGGNVREFQFDAGRFATVGRGSFVISRPLRMPKSIACLDQTFCYLYTKGDGTNAIPYGREVRTDLGEYPQSGNSADRANVVATAGSNHSGGTSTTGYNYNPLLMVRSSKPLVVLLSDSTGQYITTNKDMPRVGGFDRCGWFSMATYDFNDTHPNPDGVVHCLNLSASAEMAYSSAERDCAYMAERIEMLRVLKPDRVILGLGANDVLNGKTAEECIESLALIESRLYDAGVKEVWHSTIMPTNVATTDNFLTTGNMSVSNSGQNTIRNTINTWKRRQQFVLDLAAQVEHYASGVPQGIWKAAVNVKTGLVAHSTTTNTRIYTVTETNWTYAEYNAYLAVATSGAQNGLARIISATNNTTGPNRSLIDTGTWPGALASGDTFKIAGSFGADNVHPAAYAQQVLATYLRSVSRFWSFN
jgi:hypothetical protein